MTINGKSLTYTSTGGDTVATVLTALAAAWNSTSNPLPPPEFQEYVAVALSTTMTMTATTLGKPAGSGAITVTTGGAATFTITNTTAATGPNDFTNVQNWAGGVAPANSDTLVFDNGAIPVKYNTSTSLTGIVLSVQQGYTGTIGLPFINADATATYAEYRTRHLTLAGGTVTINAPNVSRCNLAFGANTTTVQITSTGKRVDKLTPPVLLKGGNSSSTLNISKGDVGIAFWTGDTAQFTPISTSFQSNPATDVTLFLGAGCTLTTVSMNGGSVTTNSAITTMNVESGGAGTLLVVAGAVTTLNVQGGTCIYSSSGTLGTATVSGSGTLDFSQDTQEKTLSNPILVYGNAASVLDPLKIVNSGVLSVTTTQTTALNITHGSGSAIVLT